MKIDRRREDREKETTAEQSREHEKREIANTDMVAAVGPDS